MKSRAAIWATSSIVALAAGCASRPPSTRAITSEMRHTAGDAVALEIGSPEITRPEERAAELARATGGRAIVEPLHVQEVALTTAASGERREILQGAGARALSRLAGHVVSGTLDAVRSVPSPQAPIAVAMSRTLAADLGLVVGSTFTIATTGAPPGCAPRSARVDALVVMPADDVLPDSARTLVTSNAAARVATCGGPAALRIMAIDPSRADEVVATLERRASADGLRIVPFRELHAGLIRALEARD